MAQDERNKAEADARYAAEYERLTAALHPLLTDDFLATLVEAARTCGWRLDYVEVGDFVEWCHEVAGKPVPDLKPFQTP